MKKKVGFACWGLLMALSFTFLLTACPDVVEEPITLTLTGDAQVSLNPNTLVVEKGKSWKEIQGEAEKELTVAVGYQLSAWHLENLSGEVLSDEMVFTENKTLFAETKRSEVTLTLTGDSNVTIPILTLAIYQGSTWKEIQGRVNQSITFTGSYLLKAWRFDSLTGSVVTDDFRFIADTTLFAESFEGVTLSLRGKSGVNFTVPSMVVPKGTKWIELKSMVTDQVELPDEETELSGWTFNPDFLFPTFIDDDFSFDTSKDLHAETKKSSFTLNKEGWITSWKMNGSFVFFPAKIGSKKVVGVSTIGNKNKQITLRFSGVTDLRFLGGSAFNDCVELEAPLTLPATLEEIQDGEVRIRPEFLRWGCFLNNKKLISVDFSRCQRLTLIGKFAFMECNLTGIVDLSACNALKTIGMKAFWGNKNAEIKLPSSITEIKSEAFGKSGKPATLCKKVFIPSSPDEDYRRIQELVIQSGYPSERIAAY